MSRFAPSPDPSLIIRFYERTPEQQASLGYLVDPSQLGDHGEQASTVGISGALDKVRREPHGSVGATAARRAFALSNSSEIVETVFRYSAPEEVRPLLKFHYIDLSIFISVDYINLMCTLLACFWVTGDDFPINLWSLHQQV